MPTFNGCFSNRQKQLTWSRTIHDFKLFEFLFSPKQRLQFEYHASTLKSKTKH